MMGIVVPETCSAYKKYNKIISSIHLVLILQLLKTVNSSRLCKFIYILKIVFRFLKNYLIVSQKRGVSVKKVLLFCIPGFVTIFHVLSKSPLKILTRTGDKLHP